MRLTGLLGEYLVGKFQGIYAYKGYKFFDGHRPYNLNIIGIRNNSKRADIFDDMICAVYRDNNLKWVLNAYVATTDPGRYWLENPMNERGTAILVPGQYRGALKMGKHRGKYTALVQAGPMKVWRDNNKDDILDFTGKEIPGMYGINIHRANGAKESFVVDKWSAGCQVIANPTDFAEFMEIVSMSASIFGDRFTYTLIEREDLEV